MFGNIKQAKHIAGSGALRLVDVTSPPQAKPPAAAPMFTPVPSTPASKSAIPSIATVMAKHQASEPLAHASKVAQWTAAGQVLITWKQHSGRQGRRRNWTQQSTVARSLSSFGHTLARVLSLTPQPLDATRSRLLPRGHQPSIQTAECTPEHLRRPVHGVAMSSSDFLGADVSYHVLGSAASTGSGGFSLKDVSPIKAWALEHEL
jgi:hypothetical protein